MDARLLAFAALVCGCKYIDQPKKTGELEKRVDELATAVSDLVGKPVAMKASDRAKESDEEHSDDDGGGPAKGKKKKGDKHAKKPTTSDNTEDDDSDGGGDPEGEPEPATKAAAEPEADQPDRAQSDHARPRSFARRSPEVASRDRGERDPAEADAHAAPDTEKSSKSKKGSIEEDADAKTPTPPAAPPSDVHWSYQGPTGPDAWGKLDRSFSACAKGIAQSPIDITPKKSNQEVIIAYTPSRGEVRDTGHSLQVDLSSAGFIVVNNTRFDLIQFHVHTPSEHTLAGEQFAAEVHLVHRSKTGKIAVIAVFVDNGGSSGELAAVLKSGIPKPKQPRTIKRIDPLRLLPENTNSYQYIGSLTTPPCTEGVSWIVMKRTTQESGDALSSLRKRFGDNARPVQALGDRDVR